MTTQNKKPEVEELPIVLNGNEQFVKIGQYTAHTATEQSAALGADIKKSHVKDILDLVFAGKQLDPDNSEEWQKLFQRVGEDVERGREYAEGERAKVELENQLKKQEEERKEQSELRLVTIAQNTNVAATFASMSELFDLGNMDRVVLKKEVDDETLIGALSTAMAMDNFTPWAKGDLVNLLQERGHEHALLKICEATGVPTKSLYRMATTAKQVPPTKRRAGVSFTAYAEIANARLSEDKTISLRKREELLIQVGQSIRTTQEARAAVEFAQGKTTPPSNVPNPVDTEKDTFICIGITDDPEYIVKCKGLPDDLRQEATTIIHFKTCKKLVGNKWAEIGEYVPPSVAKETSKKKGNKKTALRK